MVRLTDEQLAPIKAELERDGFLGTVSSRALLADLEEVRRERDELQFGFDLRWKADMRAIARWQEAHPERPNIWPDHADLCVWLLEQIDIAQLAADLSEHTDINLQAASAWKERAETAERERDEARAALRRTQWVYDSYCSGGSVPMGMLCPVCGNHRPEGHTADCVVGNALGGSEQQS